MMLHYTLAAASAPTKNHPTCPHAHASRDFCNVSVFIEAFVVELIVVESRICAGSWMEYNDNIT
jgi:hypothetical protein